ncbi:MAG: Asp23/Gls24 family envelope stress response protein [Streptococcaceae bacterium]|nr:Asp23/Gls24 family envelope stress response protein [Streptococcaceae bacterium]
MPVTFNTSNGKVEISTEVISTVVGTSTTEIFGVVGMTSQNSVRDNVRQILRQDNYSKGVLVKSDEDGTTIDVFVVISYGVKLSEVARNIQERVRFNLENQLGLTNVKVNVNVQSVKVTGE